MNIDSTRTFIDPITGRRFPILSGAEGGDGGDAGGEGGDGGEGSGDDGGSGGVADAQHQAALTKAHSSGQKKALKEYAKARGFNSVAEMRAADEASTASDDGGAGFAGDGNSAAGDAGHNGKQQSQSKNDASEGSGQDVASSARARRKELTADVKIALLDAGVPTEMLPDATNSVIGGLDLDDPDLDADDVTEAVDGLSKRQPGWFSGGAGSDGADGDGKGGSGSGSGVPGSSQKRQNQQNNQTPDQIAQEEFERYKAAHGRKPLRGLPAAS